MFQLFLTRFMEYILLFLLSLQYHSISQVDFHSSQQVEILLQKRLQRLCYSSLQWWQHLSVSQFLQVLVSTGSLHQLYRLLCHYLSTSIMTRSVLKSLSELLLRRKRRKWLRRVLIRKHSLIMPTLAQSRLREQVQVFQHLRIWTWLLHLIIIQILQTIRIKITKTTRIIIQITILITRVILQQQMKLKQLQMHLKQRS